MPMESALGVIAILIPFLAFAAVLMWADLWTRHLHR
jgi:hypothetical protein